MSRVFAEVRYLHLRKRPSQIRRGHDNRHTRKARTHRNYVLPDNARIHEDPERAWQTKRCNGPNPVPRDAENFGRARHRQPRLGNLSTQLLPRDLHGSRDQDHRERAVSKPKQDAANHLLFALTTLPRRLLERFHGPRMAEDLVLDPELAQGQTCRGRNEIVSIQQSACSSGLI